jgi:hypothetical protein
MAERLSKTIEGRSARRGERRTNGRHARRTSPDGPRPPRTSSASYAARAAQIRSEANARKAGRPENGDRRSGGPVAQEPTFRRAATVLSDASAGTALCVSMTSPPEEARVSGGSTAGHRGEILQQLAGDPSREVGGRCEWADDWSCRAPLRDTAPCGPSTIPVWAMAAAPMASHSQRHGGVAPARTRRTARVTTVVRRVTHRRIPARSVTVNASLEGKCTSTPTPRPRGAIRAPSLIRPKVHRGGAETFPPARTGSPGNASPRMRIAWNRIPESEVDPRQRRVVTQAQPAGVASR